MTGLDILIELLFGWFTFLNRVVPEITFRWDGIAIFGVGFLISLCCARSLLNWLSREWSQHISSVRPRWSWLATASLLTMILLVFLVGISLVGITHQAIWLGTSPDPWYESETQSAADSTRSSYQPGTIFPHETPGNWITAIMPFTMYSFDNFGNTSIDTEHPWNAPENASRFRRLMPLLINPSLEVPTKSPDGFGLSHFAGNSVVFQGTPRRLEDLSAGVMLVAEVNAGFVPWGYPDLCRDLNHGLRGDWLYVPKPQPVGFGPVRGRGTVLMLSSDCSTREVSITADPELLRQLSGVDD